MLEIIVRGTNKTERTGLVRLVVKSLEDLLPLRLVDNVDEQNKIAQIPVTDLVQDIRRCLQIDDGAVEILTQHVSDLPADAFSAKSALTMFCCNVTGSDSSVDTDHDIYVQAETVAVALDILAGFMLENYGRPLEGDPSPNRYTIRPRPFPKQESVAGVVTLAGYNKVTIEIPTVGPVLIRSNDGTVTLSARRTLGAMVRRAGNPLREPSHE